MMDRGGSELPAELERRIAVLEDPSSEGSDLAGLDWLVLAIGSIALPLLLVLWGFPP